VRATRAGGVLLLAGLVLVGGCRSSHRSGAKTPATGSTATTADPLPGSATTPVSTTATAGPSLLTDVRVDHHPGYDRIVFEFRPGVDGPGYRVRYVQRPVLEDGSGRPVTLEGRAVLEVHMEHASGADLSAGGQPTYRGPARLRAAGTTAVVEIARSGDFEGVLTWVAGIRDEARFLAHTLTDPPRVVIDVRAP